MATFKLKIKCDNAAFDPEPGFEVARLLREVASLVEGGPCRGVLRDINGNTVGEFILPERKED